MSDGRNKPGPADPATRRKLLKEKLAPAPAKKAAPAVPAVKRSVLKELRDAIDELVPREPAHQGQSVDNIVDAAQNGIDEANRVEAHRP